MQDIIRLLEKELNADQNKLEINTFKAADPKILCFTDGGSAPLIMSPTIGIFVYKIANVIYDGMKKTSTNTILFYAIIKKSQNKITVTPIDCPYLNAFSITGNHSIDEIANLVRRLAEIASADHTVVLDGSLECKYRIEKDHLDMHRQKIGVMKTSEKVLRGMIPGSIMPQSKGYAKLLDNDGFATYVCRLHKKSHYVFLVDTDDESLLHHLHRYARDPVFLGYPYPLVLVDQLARMSMEEQDQLRLRLLHLCKKNNILLDHQHSLDAHSVLDSINY